MTLSLCPCWTAIFLSSRRGTVGAGDIVEAISDPSRSTRFASRISQLIKDAKANERVRETSLNACKQSIVVFCCVPNKHTSPWGATPYLLSLREYKCLGGSYCRCYPRLIARYGLPFYGIQGFGPVDLLKGTTLRVNIRAYVCYTAVYVLYMHMCTGNVARGMRKQTFSKFKFQMRYWSPHVRRTPYKVPPLPWYWSSLHVFVCKKWISR